MPSRWLNPLWWGVAATALMAAASFGGGATRNRGGVLEVLGWSFISFGHARNVTVMLFWLGMWVLCAAWLWAGRTLVLPTLKDRQSASDDSARRAMSRAMWAWVAPLLLAGPLASRDVYSYLMQGAMVRDGFDPYTEGAAVNPGPYLLEVSHDWRNTTTPYGPLHLWLGEGITRLVGDNVAAGLIAYKAVSVAGFAVIAWAIPRIAQRLGGNPALALWLGVANPVMLLHLVGGMHNESLMVALVSVGLLLALSDKVSGFVGAVALIAVATSLKATAFIAMPFVLWLVIHRFAARAQENNAMDSAESAESAPQPKSRLHLGRACAAFVLGGIAIAVETLAVVAAVTWASGSSWGWLSEISGNSKVINPLAGPTLAADILAPIVTIFNPDATYNALLAQFRGISLILMLVGLVVVWWLARGGRRAAIFGTMAAYQVAFVFNSVTLPWYYASVISLLGTARPPRWLLKLATAASLIVALAFAGDGNHQLYNWWWMAATITVAIVAAEWLYSGLDRSGEGPEQRGVSAPTAQMEPAASAGEKLTL